MKNSFALHLGQDIVGFLSLRFMMNVMMHLLVCVMVCIGVFVSSSEVVYANGVSADVITQLQSRYSGRVVSTRTVADGKTQVQLITQENKVVVVVVDASGTVVSVKQ